MKTTKDSIVRTTGGLVQGWREDGFEHWRGMPYAAPPVGPGRFRAPAPVKPWEGTLPDTQYGAAPWQTEFSRSVTLAAPRTTTSEDCLSVNVTRAAGPDAGRPVIVYLYGGGNRTGSASFYPGAPLIGGSDAVFVSFNFRIGVLGFLDLAGLDPGGFDANLALRDQLAALSWVQQNIAAFGGALDKVERWLGATRRDPAFVDHLRADLIAFARDGQTASQWPLYEPGRGTTLVYTQTTTLIDDPHADRRAAWTGFTGYI